MNHKLEKKYLELITIPQYKKYVCFGEHHNGLTESIWPCREKKKYQISKKKKSVLMSH